MKLLLPALTATYLLISSVCATAQNNSSNLKEREPIKRFFVGNALDAVIFSLANIEKPATGPGATSTTTGNGRLRVTYAFNFGATFNFNFGRYIGMYTGLDLKNIGFTENVNSVIVKRRTYNVGIPIGIKIGNMARKGAYAFVGGGADMPINYREKSYVMRDQKVKFNEWFSERTPQIMPYAFVGFAIPRGFTFKAQYYPNNFLNPDFAVGTVKPYAGYNVHMMMLSLGYIGNHGKKGDKAKKPTEELKTM